MHRRWRSANDLSARNTLIRVTVKLLTHCRRCRLLCWRCGWRQRGRQHRLVRGRSIADVVAAAAEVNIDSSIDVAGRLSLWSACVE